MKYPTLNTADAEEYLRQRSHGITLNLHDKIEWKGQDKKCSLKFDNFFKKLQGLTDKTKKDKNGNIGSRETTNYDLSAAGIARKHLCDINSEMASDQGFWMYFTLAYKNGIFFDIILKRFGMSTDTSGKDAENIRKVFNSFRVHSCVAATKSKIKESYYARIWLCAFVSGATNYADNMQVPSLDWLRSHILRIRFGSIKYAAIEATKIAKKLSLGQQREFASFVTAKSHVYSYGSASDSKQIESLLKVFVDEIRHKKL